MIIKKEGLYLIANTQLLNFVIFKTTIHFSKQPNIKKAIASFHIN